jgi:vesicular inhibitory amino acid transporter
MNHTAKLVCRCIEWPGATFLPTSFPDLADAAFGGHWPRRIIAFMFVAELFMADIAILIVAADNLVQLYPELPSVTAKLVLATIMWATTFLDLSILSYTSLGGMISSIALVSAVVFDGVTKEERPGSLRDPMPTELWGTPYHVLLSLGILVSCLSGHAVFPSIYLTLKERKRAAGMLNIGFGIVVS